MDCIYLSYSILFAILQDPLKGFYYDFLFSIKNQIFAQLISEKTYYYFFEIRNQIKP